MEDKIISIILNDVNTPLEYKEYFNLHTALKIDSFQGSSIHYLNIYKIREKIYKHAKDENLIYAGVKRLVEALEKEEPDHLLNCNIIYFEDCSFGVWSKPETNQIYSIIKSSPIKGGFMNPHVIR